MPQLIDKTIEILDMKYLNIWQIKNAKFHAVFFLIFEELRIKKVHQRKCIV